MHWANWADSHSLNHSVVCIVSQWTLISTQTRMPLERNQDVSNHSLLHSFAFGFQIRYRLNQLPFFVSLSARRRSRRALEIETLGLVKETADSFPTVRESERNAITEWVFPMLVRRFSYMWLILLIMKFVNNKWILLILDNEIDVILFGTQSTAVHLYCKKICRIKVNIEWVRNCKNRRRSKLIIYHKKVRRRC